MAPEPTPFRIREIQSEGDPAWAGWRRIYLESFPESERMSDAYFQGLLARKNAGDAPDSHVMIMETDPVTEPLGIAYFETDPELRAGFLWYLALRAGDRGRGLGATLYRHLANQCRDAGMQLLIFEVEIPEQESLTWAERRIAWYRRQGAQLLGGIRYLQSVDTGGDPVEMHLMAHLFAPATPNEVFEVASGLFGDALERIGPLSLT